jgi:glycosyltransferase involved in cell wall biosynthesis
MDKLSIILPSKNESAALLGLLPELKQRFPDAEIIVVDDGSTDQTATVCAQNNVVLRSHPYSMGNGAAVKSGARIATGDVLVFMDADGQHKPEDVQRLLDKLAEGYDMVVGARNYASQAGVHRAAANGLYNRMASWMVGQSVKDLTSGFRAVNARKFRRFLYLLPNQFSYPTTITMSFFRAGFLIAYIPIVAPKRIGKSHLQPWRDGMRFLLIIFKIGTLYSPLRIFFPISMTFFGTGMGYYLYTLLTVHRFTNMSALLITTAVLVFLIGLVSEQITSLMHQSSGSDDA